jgi:hypothetical protein
VKVGTEPPSAHAVPRTAGDVPGVDVRGTALRVGERAERALESGNAVHCTASVTMRK